MSDASGPFGAIREALLIRRLRARDERAFEEIVRRPNEQEAVLRAMAVRCLAPGAI